MSTFTDTAQAAHLAWCAECPEHPTALVIVVGETAIVPVSAANLEVLLDNVHSWGPRAAIEAGALVGLILHGVMEGSDPLMPVTFARPADGTAPLVLVGAQAAPEPGDPDTAATVADYLLRGLGASWS